MGGLSAAALFVASIAGDASGEREAADDRGRKAGYRGVAPGAEGGAPSQCRRQRKGTGITWVGFQAREDGGARLFVQLCDEVAYDQELRDGRLLVTLRGAAYTSKNTRRPLDTRFFPGPLARVASQDVKRRRGGARQAGVVLEIRFKEDTEARTGQATMRREPDGHAYLYLDF